MTPMARSDAVSSQTLDRGLTALAAIATADVAPTIDQLAGALGVHRSIAYRVVRTLEAHGLVRAAGERRWGGLTERLLVATAASYVVSPDALGPVATDPGRGPDRLSASYLIALAARIVREVGDLLRRSREIDKRLPTLSIDAEIQFRSAADRAAFGGELAAAVKQLAARYHDPSAPDGRRHRLVVVAHPLPREARKEQPPCP
jgi:hypothetical protein